MELPSEVLLLCFTRHAPRRMSLTRVTQASGLIYAAESGSNAQISDFFDALYFGLTTLTTVGFGDITPVTPVGVRIRLDRRRHRARTFTVDACETLLRDEGSWPTGEPGV